MVPGVSGASQMPAAQLGPAPATTQEGSIPLGCVCQLARGLPWSQILKNQSRSCKWQLTGSPVTRLDTSSCSNPSLRNRGFLCNTTRYAHLYHLLICEQQRGGSAAFELPNVQGKSKGCPPPCARPAVAPGKDAATSLGKGPRPAQNRWQTRTRRT